VWMFYSLFPTRFSCWPFKKSNQPLRLLSLRFGPYSLEYFFYLEQLKKLKIFLNFIPHRFFNILNLTLILFITIFFFKIISKFVFFFNLILEFFFLSNIIYIFFVNIAIFLPWKICLDWFFFIVSSYTFNWSGV
jgi:hypothetical protein